MSAAKALASLQVCAGLPEPLLLDNMIWKSHLLAHAIYSEFLIYKILCLLLFVHIRLFSIWYRTHDTEISFIARLKMDTMR